MEEKEGEEGEQEPKAKHPGKWKGKSRGINWRLFDFRRQNCRRGKDVQDVEIEPEVPESPQKSDPHIPPSVRAYN